MAIPSWVMNLHLLVIDILMKKNIHIEQIKHNKADVNERINENYYYTY
jgi:hypothetical protein